MLPLLNSTTLPALTSHHAWARKLRHLDQNPLLLMASELHGRPLAVLLCLVMILTAVFSAMVTFCITWRYANRRRGPERHAQHPQSCSSISKSQSSQNEPGQGPESSHHNASTNPNASATYKPGPSSSASPEFLWNPQPRDFQIQEHKLMNDFQSLYILERVGDLRSTITSLAANITWKSAAFSRRRNAFHTFKKRLNLTIILTQITTLSKWTVFQLRFHVRRSASQHWRLSCLGLWSLLFFFMARKNIPFHLLCFSLLLPKSRTPALMSLGSGHGERFESI